MHTGRNGEHTSQRLSSREPSYVIIYLTCDCSGQVAGVGLHPEPGCQPKNVQAHYSVKSILLQLQRGYGSKATFIIPVATEARSNMSYSRCYRARVMTHLSPVTQSFRTLVSDQVIASHPGVSLPAPLRIIRQLSLGYPNDQFLRPPVLREYCDCARARD